ncbi:MAG: hypothetical protein OXF50_08495 [Caldilineaceae bacterium]|nr:hypothetical protein [Caldilineaceae bacterium]
MSEHDLRQQSAADLRIHARKIPVSRRFSSWPFKALRGQKGVLRDPPRDFADKKVFFVALRIQKGVLCDPSRYFADEKVFFDTLVS